MKILIAVPDTRMGGITTSAVNFSNELTKRGHEVFFLDMSGEHQCADRLDHKVNSVSLKGRSSLWNIGASSVKKMHGIKKAGILLLGFFKKITVKSGFWYRLIFSKFKEYGEFDVAVAFRQCAPCYSFVLNKVNAKNKLGFVHGELKYMGDISSWQKYMTSFDKVAYVSNAVREEFTTAYPELKKNACTIYNMFNIEQIKRMADELPAVELDKAKINIVTVARIDNAFKQTHWIVEICERLKEQTDTPFHWYVVGDGPDYDETVALAHERGVEDVLTFVGEQENPYTFMKQSDFTVLTSKSEAYPMVVIESFVLGKPIVVAKYGSSFEMIQHGQNGLVAGQSIDSLTACILDMIEDADDVRTRCTDHWKQHTITNDIAYAQFITAVEGKCER